jgi:hypothetical protein
MACLLSACGGGSIESLICSQDPAGCSDDGGTGGNGGSGGNGGNGGTTTVDNSTGIYDALAGSYSASGSASLTLVEKASGSSRSGGNDT